MLCRHTQARCVYTVYTCNCLSDVKSSIAQKKNLYAKVQRLTRVAVHYTYKDFYAEGME